MKNFGIKGKLIFAFLAASLLPLGVISYYSYEKAKSALEMAAKEQVESSRRSAQQGLDQFFRGVYGQMITLSNSYGVLQAFKDFRYGFEAYQKEARLSPTDVIVAKQRLADYYKNEFGGEYAKQNDGKTRDALSGLNALTDEQIIMQAAYISDSKYPLGNKHKLDAAPAGTSYNRTHAIHHANFREYLEKFGYYDIFLVDAETGNVVYSVFKELDFATSLKTGPYANTSIGKVFRDAVAQTDTSKVSMSDYEQYLPSYDAPAGFVASSIFENGKVVGVLIFQLSFDEINKVTLLETTKYKSLETFLVGPDFKMRSDTKGDAQNRNVRASFRNPEKGSIKNWHIEAALKGESHLILDNDYIGRPVVATFGPYDVFGHRWVLKTIVTQEEAFAAIREMRIALIIGALVAAGLVAGLALWYARSLAEKLTRLAAGLRSGAETVSSTSTTIADVSGRLSEASTEQAASLQETVSSIDEISAMVQRNADSAASSLKATEKSTVTAQQGKERVTFMLEAINDISNENDAIMSSVQKSNNEITEIVRVIREIADKTKVINDIVFQTKLLSFNASVEAARAGEHGKGFAVVAEEVGNLASMSGKAATEISDMLDKSVHKVNAIVDNTKGMMESLMKSSKTKVDVGTRAAKECSQALDEILRNVTSVNELVAEITTASQEQSSGVREITKAMSELDQVTQSNSSIANQSSHTAQELREQSEQLARFVNELAVIVQGDTSSALAHGPVAKGTAANVLSLDTFKAQKPKVETKKVKRVVGGADVSAPSATDSRFEDV